MQHRNALQFVAVGLILLSSASASAQSALVDYVGFGFDSTTVLDITDSQPGDELVILTTASSIDPVFGAEAGAEVTIVLSGLISTGAFESGGTTIIAYTGGTLSMYDDLSNDADWGTNPPNGTAPSSFENGRLLFEGSFTSFTLFFNNGIGAYEGMLDATDGASLAQVCADCAYSFAGAFTEDANAQIPTGYDFQVDGTLQVDSSVDGEESSFGAVKSLFGN